MTEMVERVASRRISKSDIVLDFQGGYYTQAEIAEIHGCSKQYVNQVLDACVPDRARRYTLNDSCRLKEKIISMRKADRSCSDIAASLGTTKGVVAGVWFRYRRQIDAALKGTSDEAS